MGIPAASRLECTGRAPSVASSMLSESIPTKAAPAATRCSAAARGGTRAMESSGAATFTAPPVGGDWMWAHPWPSEGAAQKEGGGGGGTGRGGGRGGGGGGGGGGSPRGILTVELS